MAIIIGCTIYFSYIIAVDVNLKLNEVIEGFDDITNCPILSKDSEYAVICNYRPHLNLSKSITNYNEINQYTLSGVIHIIKETPNMRQLHRYFYKCNELRNCIGFSFHPTAGIFFHNTESIPLQHVQNWQFYVTPHITNMKQPDLLKIHRQKKRYLRIELVQNETQLNISTVPRSYISFAWNYGGANNQIMSFAQMLKFCVVFHRTLIIPFPINDDQFIGLSKEYSLWDLEKLSEICDFSFEEEIVEKDLFLLRYRYLTLNRDDHNNETLLNECDFDGRISYGVDYYMLNDCKLIHIINGQFGILYNNIKDIHGLYQFFIPHKYIRQAVSKRIYKIFDDKHNPYRVGIFRRTLKVPDGEVADEKTNQKYYCRAWDIGLSHGIHSWSKNVRQIITKNEYLMKYNHGEIKKKLASIYDLYDRTCAANWYDIEQILQFHQQDPINVEQREKWYLASDWIEAQDVENRWIDKYNAFTVCDNKVPNKNELPSRKSSNLWSKNNKFIDSMKNVQWIISTNYLKYLEMNSISLNKKNKGWVFEHWQDKMELMYWKKERMLFNMWMLSKSDFFISSWFSTVTHTICRWRGKELMYKSTTCYLEDKWNSTRGKLWFDIHAIDSKPKLHWNNVETLDIK